MIPPDFTDPLGSFVPALERVLLRRRALQMMLVLFYVEQLKTRVVNMIAATDRLRARKQGSDIPKISPKVAFARLAKDGALTQYECDEIASLIDQRNYIGHEIHKLMADLSPHKKVREYMHYMTGTAAFSDNAVSRLRFFHDKLNKLYRTHHYVSVIGFDALLFRAAEKTFERDIKSLSRRARRLIEERKRNIASLNAELSLADTGLTEEHGPHSIYCQYESGRLTKLGAEVCYRLFDHGKSPMAVAHLLRFSLQAARHRHRMWLDRGGRERQRVEFESIPLPVFRPRYRNG